MTLNIHLLTGGSLLIAVDYCTGIILRVRSNVRSLHLQGTASLL